LGQDGLKLWTFGDKIAIGIRAGGVVYPVFPEDSGNSWEEGARVLFGQVTDAWCLMGPSTWVVRAEPLMPPSVLRHRVEYDFLFRPAQELSVPPGVGDLRLAEPSDAGVLFPLQEGYEKEEVLFRASDFQPLASRLHLGKTLKTQQIVALWEKGKPVAKAGTNAITAGWGQIGGVYTRRDYRGRGCQKRLMSFLMQRLASQSRGACLFVKKTNPAALGLYLSLGFRPAGEFLITYGERTR